MTEQTKSKMTLLQATRSITKTSRRGIVLLISLMIMLAVSGLGLIAVQTAGLEQDVTGNFRLNRQAEYATESALMTGLGVVSQQGEGFWTVFSRSMRNGGSDSVVLTNTDFAGMLFQNADDPTNPILTGDATNLNPQVTVTISDPIDGVRSTGNEQGMYCFKRLTFDAAGTVGSDPDLISQNEKFFRSSSYSVRSQGVLGPIECEGN